MSRSEFNALSTTTIARLARLHAALCDAVEAPNSRLGIDAAARLAVARDLVGDVPGARILDPAVHAATLAEALAFVDRCAAC